MGISRNVRRTFPFFKRELKVTVESLDFQKSVKEISNEITNFFVPEIPNVLEIKKKQSIKNLRGRPEVSNGAEVGREILLKIQGQALSRLTQEKVPFEATVETKFKEFLEGAIYYLVFSNIPDGLEIVDFSSLVSSPEVELSKLEIGLDYFENKEFPFLGMKLQGLKERFYVAFTENSSEKSSRLSGLIENNNLQSSNGFSEKICEKIAVLERITGIPGLVKRIND